MNTNVHNVRDLAIKGFGFYCLGRFVNLLPEVVMLFQPEIEAPLSALLGSFFFLAGYAALGISCLFRTHRVMRLFWRSDAPPPASPPVSKLALLCGLAGLYFAIRAAGSVAFFACQLAQPNIPDAGRLIGTLMTLAIALWAVRNSKSIAEFICSREPAGV